MAPCAGDGAWRDTRRGQQTTINAFFGNYSAGKTGPGVQTSLSYLNPSWNSRQNPQRFSRDSTHPSLGLLGFGGGSSVFRRAEGTSAVTVRGRWVRPPVCRETNPRQVYRYPTSLNHLASRKTLLSFSSILFVSFRFAEPRLLRFFCEATLLWRPYRMI